MSSSTCIILSILGFCLRDESTISTFFAFDEIIMLLIPYPFPQSSIFSLMSLTLKVVKMLSR